MSNPVQANQANQAPQATRPTPAQAAARPGQRAISDPREVAAEVMARIQQVKAKRDEMGAAIDALADLTRQLTRTYGAQLVAIEQLRSRVKALEAQVAAQATPPQAMQ